MRVKSLWASTLWRGVYVILIAAALVADFGFLEGRADWHILNYYTLLSNIACLIFFGLSFAAGIGALRRGERDFVWRPRCEGAIVFCIAVTGIVYATMLAPADIAEGRFFTFENLMLHYTGPIMAVMDWLEMERRIMRTCPNRAWEACTAGRARRSAPAGGRSSWRSRPRRTPACGCFADRGTVREGL